MTFVQNQKYVNYHTKAFQAAYILYRCPTRSLQESQTSAELWFGRKPDKKQFLIFFYARGTLIFLKAKGENLMKKALRHTWSVTV